MENLGFLVNKEKSKSEPSNSAKLSGFIWNTQEMRIELTQDKKQKILVKA